MLTVLVAFSISAASVADPIDWRFPDAPLSWVFPVRPKVLPQAPLPKPAVRLSYEEAALLAKARGEPLLVWIATPDGQAVAGAVTVHIAQPLAPWWPQRGAVVSVWIGDTHVGRVLDGPITAATVSTLAAQIRADGVPK